MAQTAYRSGHAHVVAELDEERQRLLREHERLGSVDRRTARDLSRLQAALDAPVTSSVDAQQLRSALREYDTALECAHLSRRSRRRRLFPLAVLASIAAVTLAIVFELEHVGEPFACGLRASCETLGQCGEVDDTCMPTETAHCTQSLNCQTRGQCGLVDGRCEPMRDEHCRQSEGCRLRQRCLRAFRWYGRVEVGCVELDALSWSFGPSGKAGNWYRDAEVARRHERESGY